MLAQIVRELQRHIDEVNKQGGREVGVSDLGKSIEELDFQVKKQIASVHGYNDLPDEHLDEKLKELGIRDAEAYTLYGLNGDVSVHKERGYIHLTFNADLEVHANGRPFGIHIEAKPSKDSSVLKSTQDLVKSLLNCEVKKYSEFLDYTDLECDDYKISFSRNNIRISREGAAKSLKPEVDDVRKLFRRYQAYRDENYELKDLKHKLK